MVYIPTFDYQCPVCKGRNVFLDLEEGNIVCKDDGTVIKTREIDYGREWRNFLDESSYKKVRTGYPITFAIHDKGLITDVKLAKNLSGGQKASQNNLNKYQRRVRMSSGKDRNLYLAFEFLERVCSNFNLPDYVKETAAIIYRRAITENKKNKSIKGLMLASIFLTCKIHNIPLPLNELIKFAGFTRRNFSRCYRYLLEKMPNDILNKINSSNNALLYIPKIVKEINLSIEVENLARQILSLALENGLSSGKTAKALAAAAVYLACILTNQKKTQSEIAKIAGITEVTIRNRCKELINNIDVEIKL